MIDRIPKIGFTSDVLGEVCEHFVAKFATAEGKEALHAGVRGAGAGGHAVAAKGRICDPCCGSGGMFVQSEKFIASHGGKSDDVSIPGQESNPTTLRLVAMNPGPITDNLLANPPFRVSNWWSQKLEGDERWASGTRLAGNANYGIIDYARVASSSQPGCLAVGRISRMAFMDHRGPSRGNPVTPRRITCVQLHAHTAPSEPATRQTTSRTGRNH